MLSIHWTHLYILPHKHALLPHKKSKKPQLQYLPILYKLYVPCFTSLISHWEVQSYCRVTLTIHNQRACLICFSLSCSFLGYLLQLCKKPAFLPICFVCLFVCSKGIAALYRSSKLTKSSVWSWERGLYEIAGAFWYKGILSFGKCPGPSNTFFFRTECAWCS